jgi:hypothetical protein
MSRLLNHRRIVLAYSVAGLLAGIGFSTWHFWDSLSAYYRDPDGELTRTARPGKLDLWTDPDTYDACVSFVPGTRPLTFWEKFWIRLPDALPIPFAGVAVGLFWGLVHLKIHEAMADPFGDEQRLDYEDSISRNRPPVST